MLKNKAFNTEFRNARLFMILLVHNSQGEKPPKIRKKVPRNKVPGNFWTSSHWKDRENRQIKGTLVQKVPGNLRSQEFVFFLVRFFCPLTILGRFCSQFCLRSFQYKFKRKSLTLLVNKLAFPKNEVFNREWLFHFEPLSGCRKTRPGIESFILELEHLKPRMNISSEKFFFSRVWERFLQALERELFFQSLSLLGRIPKTLRFRKRGNAATRNCTPKNWRIYTSEIWGPIQR